MPSSAQALKLLDLVQSHRITAVIYVAAKLGLAELLHNGPMSLGELVDATGADRHALKRLLLALSTIGICAPIEDDRYGLTEVGDALDGRASCSFKDWTIFECEMLVKSWSGLLETVMTGKTAAQGLGLNNSFDLMSRTPESVEKFNAAMMNLTRFVTPEILSAYDFSGISHLMDIGGGTGELIGGIVAKYPKLRGTAFDLPRCADAANDHLRGLGVTNRASFLAGDFFDAIPAIADAMVLKSVIHDWDDEQSRTILRNCRQALPERGLLLIIERILPVSPASNDIDKSHAMSDLNMLRGPGGRERTETEYRHLLSESGFCAGSIYPAGRFNVIESRVM
jgi:O-methyltransferase